MSLPFQVSTQTNNPQLDPDVGCDESGSCVVVWANLAGYRSIQARRLDAAGGPVGPEIQVTSITSDHVPDSPAVAVEPDGDFVVVWRSSASLGNDTESYSIQGRRFSVNWLFLDGFESGDTANWSTTVP